MIFGQGEGEGGGGVVGSKLLQRHQRQEVDRAGLEGLVDCPFCEYATVMEGEADRVLVCRNPDYGRESCRLCRETNHVPLRCDEAEKTEGVRKEIEEKLTEAMIRQCWRQPGKSWPCTAEYQIKTSKDFKRHNSLCVLQVLYVKPGSWVLEPGTCNLVCIRSLCID